MSEHARARESETRRLKGRIGAMLIGAALVVGILLLLNRGGDPPQRDQGAVHFLGGATTAVRALHRQARSGVWRLSAPACVADGGVLAAFRQQDALVSQRPG